VKGVLELASFDTSIRRTTPSSTSSPKASASSCTTIEANTAHGGSAEAVAVAGARNSSSQQQELQLTNQQLEEKAKLAGQKQNVEVERRTPRSSRARQALEEKAKQLALTSGYKSEFLANMSHELRTPLNSILILGQQLSDNPEHNLTPKQVEFARTIHGAGTDLLNLITDILDLSKIESGTVTVEAEEIFFTNLLEMVIRTFKHDAENRGLSFDVQVDPRLGRSIVTDSKRLQQVLKNLLSNAFKFTSQGGVRLIVSEVAGGWTQSHPVLSQAGRVVSFEVSDTGIGIPPEKQRIIFEAFQQADASTSRKFGGTGLGLAISRKLSNLLGGEIQLRSTPTVGSTFTLYLPLRYAGPLVSARSGDGAATTGSAGLTVRLPATRVSERPTEVVADDRENLRADDPTLLIVEDDPHYARILVDLAHDKGFQVLVAMRGSEALSLARQYRPMAVSLDVFLPDMLGWTVLSQLKHDPETRHIPVQIVTLDEDRQHGLARGAFAFVTKPSSREGLAEVRASRVQSRPRRKRLLIVEDNAAEQLSITELLGPRRHRHRRGRAPAPQALARLRRTADRLRGARSQAAGHVRLRCPGSAASPKPSPVGHPGRGLHRPELSPEEDAQLHTMARSVVVKGVESPERLLDETALFLHRVVYGPAAREAAHAGAAL
jgi:signal transduction histidine kinase/DNA-binding response OmpR family regulator